MHFNTVYVFFSDDVSGKHVDCSSIIFDSSVSVWVVFYPLRSYININVR